MHRLIQCLTIVVLMLSTGCARIPATSVDPTLAVEPTNSVAATAPANSIPKLSADWRIVLTQSGGFVGMSKSFEILSSGAVTVTDLRTKKISKATLSADNLKKLADLVANSSYQPPAVPAGCADCFIFNLEITSGGQKFQVEMNQIDLQKSGLQALVDLIGVMMNSIQK